MDRNRRSLLAASILLTAAALCVWTGTRTARAGTGEPGVRGQTLYVPVYSHIYGGDKEQRIDLTATLSIRNVDMAHALSIEAVDYYDTDGVLLKHYIEGPVTLAPLASTRFVVKESDKSGGSGANFIVRWSAEGPVQPPLVEAVMIGTRNQLGISFSAQSRVLATEGGGPEDPDRR